MENWALISFLKSIGHLWRIFGGRSSLKDSLDAADVVFGKKTQIPSGLILLAGWRKSWMGAWLVLLHLKLPIHGKNGGLQLEKRQKSMIRQPFPSPLFFPKNNLHIDLRNRKAYLTIKEAFNPALMVSISLFLKPSYIILSFEGRDFPKIKGGKLKATWLFSRLMVPRNLGGVESSLPSLMAPKKGRESLEIPNCSSKALS